MIENIQGIKLSKSGFLSDTVLDIFKSKASETARIALIYGKNGSGKSTIAKSIREAAILSGTPENDLPLFLDNQLNAISINEPLSNSVFVFDETYIDKNIKFNEEHLDTIVLLGKQKSLDDDLKKAESELSKLQTQKKLLEKEKSDLENIESQNSKLYWLNKIKEALKGDGSWAERDRKIKGNRNNSAVNDETYKQFKKPLDNKAKSDLIIKFNEQLEELNDKRNAGNVNLQPLVLNVISQFDTKEFVDLLNRVLETNNLTERENKIIEIIENSSLATFEEIKEYFEKEDTAICPYCFQNISFVYKNEVLDSIGKILNKEVEEYKAKLEKFRVSTTETQGAINFDEYRVLKSTSLDRLQHLWGEYTESLSKINKLVETKQTSPYAHIEVVEIQIEYQIIELKKLIDVINKEIDVYNASHSVDILKSELFQLNKDLTYYEISVYLEAYSSRVSKEIKFLDSYNELKDSIKNKMLEVNDIKQKLKNEKIAINLINKWLAYIFYSDNRLKVKCRDSKYYLYSRGESVSPDKISVGERNAIALCYFFLSTMVGDSEDKLYEKECYLVIDDPISSLDIDNRIGLLSFLRYQLEQYISKNTNTKVLIMTHDLQIFFDLEKVGKQVSEFYNQKNKGDNNRKKLGINKYQLVNKQLSLLETKDHHEYTKLLEQVYKYANGTMEESSDMTTIGNSMRRVLEAFSTFLFKQSIEKVTYCPEVQEDLNKFGLCDYFRNHLYRFVLHGGSHMSERIKGLSSTDFIDYLTIEEKQRTAKDIILFLYCINSGHILVHLKDFNEVESVIESWLKEAKSIG